DRFSCVIRNLLSLVDVPFKEEDNQIMWQQNLSADCTYPVTGDEEKVDVPEIVIPKMIDICQKYIECVCVG
ncbi:MAG: hypothetical protein K2H85_04470, partial [Allobaculum sp.]|nr:hypothetical protein [Allobaculum sp.]